MSEKIDFDELKTALENVIRAVVRDEISKVTNTEAAKKPEKKSTKAKKAEKPKKEEPEVTFEEVKDALFAVYKAQGEDSATELLHDFGADKLSELDKEDYANFVKACTKQLEVPWE